MPRSMTGFGRSALGESEKYNFNVEIKSINHRYLDLNIKLPRTLTSLEEKIRKCIIAKLSRGKVDVFVTLNNQAEKGVKTKVNETLCDSYFNSLNYIKQKYNLKDEITLGLITKFPDVIILEQEDEDLESILLELMPKVEDAILNLITMRTVEGEKLKTDILSKCSEIKSKVNELESLSKTLVISYREKLINRLKELKSDLNIDENRLMLELSIYADKSSIDEEITRLLSHIDQVLITLEDKSPVGRKLDFIIQEMNREANTIASKATNLDITNIAISIKNDIEKIREQVQNIE